MNYTVKNSDKQYYIGGYRNDGLNEPNRGWIVGTLLNGNIPAPRKNDDVSIKYWEFSKGPTNHPTKISAIIECTFVFSGKLRAIIDGVERIISAGEYVVIEPGIANNLAVECIEDAKGLTVKAPSDPTAKTVINA